MHLCLASEAQSGEYKLPAVSAAKQPAFHSLHLCYAFTLVSHFETAAARLSCLARLFPAVLLSDWCFDALPRPDM